MTQITKQKTKKTVTSPSRSYQEVISLLDSKWDGALLAKNPQKMLALDKALGNPSHKVKTIFVGGSNGKSLTINFTTQLLRAEGFNVGSFYAPHYVSYNERIACNNETVSNPEFTGALDEVLSTAELNNIELHAYEALFMGSLVHFANKKMDVALLEISHQPFDPAMICTPDISVITRITNYAPDAKAEEISQKVAAFGNMIKKDSWIVCADQCKASLQQLESMTAQAQANWAMPIRKLAVLQYPYEQLYGRCAALAERIAQIFVQSIAHTSGVIVNESLLAKPKGQRGRPTIEAKRQSELHPKKTIDQYWQETLSTLHSRFQQVEKTEPQILLDNASNIDAIENILLGVRLLHYKRPLKGLVFIIGCENNDLLRTEFYKMLRYFFKKTAGQVVFCPVVADAQGTAPNFDFEQITNDAKNVKVKAKAMKSLSQSLEYAKKAVDEKEGLIVITGSRALVSEYWQLKGAKR